MGSGKPERAERASSNKTRNGSQSGSGKLFLMGPAEEETNADHVTQQLPRAARGDGD